MLYPVRGHQCVLNLEKFALNFAFSANILQFHAYISMVRQQTVCVCCQEPLTDSHTLLSLLKAIIQVSLGNQFVLFRLACLLYGMESFL